jgi:hypothetical protein
MDSSDHPSDEAKSEPALVLDDVTPLDLRKFGESVPLPAPFGFSIPSAEWPTSRG